MMSATRPRRALVITYHFPPDGAVGGLRWFGLAKYLARRGWEVHVVTSAPAGDLAMPPGVHRHEQPRRRTLNDAYNAAARRVGRSGATPPNGAASAAAAPAAQNGARPGPVARTLMSVRILGRLAMGFPDFGRGWVTPAAMRARRLLREREFDLVVTSGPPHSAHLAGWLATVGRREPLVVDMRDPWVYSREYLRQFGAIIRGAHAVIAALQRMVFRRASLVIANTLEAAERLRGRNPRLRVVHVSNGIDLDELPARTAERFDGFSLAYVGTLYIGRNFSTVLSALQSLRESRPGAAGRLKLRIAGHMDAPHEARFRAELAERGITDMVEMFGRTPRAQALDLLVRSDLALVLAQRQPAQVPAKLYESVGLRVPTLVISEPESAATREARRIGALALDSADAAGMREILDQLVNGELPSSISPTAPITYDALSMEMDKILTDVASQGRSTSS